MKKISVGDLYHSNISNSIVLILSVGYDVRFFKMFIERETYGGDRYENCNIQNVQEFVVEGDWRLLSSVS